jgi:hypothetical protein
MANPLYRVQEFPEVFADACLRDSAGVLKFLSVYGRDGSLMQFEAALQLGYKEGGVKRFHLIGDDNTRHAVEVGSVDALTKYSGRLPRQNVFGPLSQLWLYDKALTDIDRANRIGWALHRGSPGQGPVERLGGLLDQAWDLTRKLSPIALQDAWRVDLQGWCLEKRAYQRLDDGIYPPLGQVEAMRVSISDHFLRYVSAQVQQKNFVL